MPVLYLVSSGFLFKLQQISNYQIRNYLAFILLAEYKIPSLKVCYFRLEINLSNIFVAKVEKNQVKFILQLFSVIVYSLTFKLIELNFFYF